MTIVLFVEQFRSEAGPQLNAVKHKLGASIALAPR